MLAKPLPLKKDRLARSRVCSSHGAKAGAFQPLGCPRSGTKRTLAW
jgi:hypothetical protein